MKLRSLVLAFLAFGLLTPSAFAWSGGDDHHGPRFAPISPVTTRQVNLTLRSGFAAPGQPDFQVAVVPPSGVRQAAVVCSPVNGSWAAAIAGTNWMSVQADCTAPLDLGNYTYTEAFRLPANFSQASLSGQVMADDEVTVQLNGTAIFSQTSGGTFGGPASFSTTDNSLFQAGVNTLTFIVHNDANASGLDYLATVSATVSAPAPGPGRGRHRGRGRGNHGDNDNDGD